MSEKLSEFLHHWLGQRVEDVEVLDGIAVRLHGRPVAVRVIDLTAIT